MAKTIEEIFKEAKQEAEWMSTPFGDCLDYEDLAVKSLGLWHNNNKRYSWKRLAKLVDRFSMYLSSEFNKL